MGKVIFFVERENGISLRFYCFLSSRLESTKELRNNTQMVGFRLF